MALINWRTILRGLLTGLGAWLLTMPEPLQQIGAAVMAIGVSIGSSANSVKAGSHETIVTAAKGGSK